MRLFKIHHRTEGQTFSDNTFLSVGKNHINGVYDGWYIYLQLPFVKTMSYIDPHDFYQKTGKCRKVLFWKKRTRYSEIFHTSMWKPIGN